ncbi:Insulinase (Peptidase M16) [Allomyces javanicus]|nr:Insulinase (Peptidase M16) [Allomyces javanicus]
MRAACLAILRSLATTSSTSFGSGPFHLAATTPVTALLPPPPYLNLSCPPPALSPLLSRAATFSTMSTPPRAVPYTVLADTAQLRRPDLDERQYRLIRLNHSGLTALVVSDPKTDKAAAALDVHVGHYQDPDDLPGLAHFAEHLSFMGTKKYPRENEYGDYLAKHGGHSNAFTSHSNTNYYFEVHADHLDGALDRFAQFFHAPLFSESCTDRELRAVDSENSKNLQVDVWRLSQLRKSLSDPTHPYHKFGTGDLNTLCTIPAQRGIDVRKALLDFHQKYYSANLMRVVVLGKDPLDTLTQWVVDRFAPVQSTNAPVPADTITAHPWDTKDHNYAGHLVRAKSVKDTKQLVLRWRFPAAYAHWRAKPDSYLSHLVGHEGQGSLLSLLKHKGWATDLSAGTEGVGHTFDFFSVTVVLTESGFAQWHDVVAAVYEYLAVLRQARPLPKWIHDELQVMADIRFRFQELGSVSSWASRMAGLMQKPQVPPELALAASTLVLDWRPELIEQGLDALLNTEPLVMLTAPAFGETWVPSAKEKWYGTEYSVEKLDAAKFDQWRAQRPGTALSLPAPNALLPKNLDVVRHTTKQPHPHLIKNTPLVRCWAQVDDTFFVPRASLTVRFKTPVINASPRHYVLTELLVEYVEDVLNEDSYDAHLAGLSSSISMGPDAVRIGLYGFADNLDVLLLKMVDALLDPHKIAAVFDRLHRNKLRRLRNWDLEAPYQHAMFDLHVALEETVWSPTDRRAAIEIVTAADVAAHARTWLASGLLVESYLLGNMPSDKYLAWMDTVVTRIQTAVPTILPLTPHQRTARRAVHLPVGNAVASRAVTHAQNVNSAVDWYVQVGPATDYRARVLAGLVVHLAREPAFNMLRTQRQLGYLVFTDVRRQANTVGVRVLVQSEYAPGHVEECIEAFWRDWGRDTVPRITAEEWGRHVGVYVDGLLEKPKNLAQVANRMWGAVASDLYDFDSREVMAGIARGVGLAEVVAFVATHLAPSSPGRRKLAVHLASQVPSKKVPDTDEARVVVTVAMPTVEIADVVEWKARQALLPTAMVKL